jgi:hypothetical protein
MAAIRAELAEGDLESWFWVRFWPLGQVLAASWFERFVRFRSTREFSPAAGGG